MVALADQDPALRRLERNLSEQRLLARQSLILLHPATTHQPQGTARWLAPRSLHAHHHVRLGVGADVARLARHLTERAVGVVFSGGGAKGLAHIGALAAMQEAGVTVDRVAGTSQGALIAGLVALLLDEEAMVERCIQVTDRIGYTLPLVSLASGRNWTRAMKRLYGEVYIEDLWLPYLSLSASLSRNEPVVHDAGPLWRAVRASTSIPGLLPPIQVDEDLLVDGGVISNVPIDVMRERIGGGTIWALDVNTHESTRRYPRLQGSVSGWQVLQQRLGGARQPIAPSLPQGSHRLDAAEHLRARSAHP